MSTTSAASLINGSVLTNAAVSYYTSPAQTTTVIKKLTLLNADTVAHTVTITIGATDDAAHTIWKTVTVPAVATGQNSSAEVFEAENHVMNPGDHIWALADTGAQVSIKASGFVIQ